MNNRARRAFIEENRGLTTHMAANEANNPAACGTISARNGFGAASYESSCLIA
jgi:hypothetical protein